MRPTATGQPSSPTLLRGSGALNERRNVKVNCKTMQKTQQNVGQGDKVMIKMGIRQRKRHVPVIAAGSGGGIREIRQKRDSISSYRSRHITLAHPEATQRLPASLASLQTSVTERVGSMWSHFVKCAGKEVDYLFSLVLLAVSLSWSLH